MKYCLILTTSGLYAGIVRSCVPPTFAGGRYDDPRCYLFPTSTFPGRWKCPHVTHDTNHPRDLDSLTVSENESGYWIAEISFGLAFRIFRQVLLLYRAMTRGSIRAVRRTINGAGVSFHSHANHRRTLLSSSFFRLTTPFEPPHAISYGNRKAGHSPSQLTSLLLSDPRMGLESAIFFTRMLSIAV
ncbi:hypothetical protein DFJ58DRAFT_29546 [Suillus subalutaceus]|uniref:uncharacterized protein n=1 Tax=Suillus subalutaceus TaxID=48586 RepID=UPI001B876889|nr:uncharacterized protein DFJ58DRAFT_29546 [Suillus subalutaceus]KAG1844345.1 hypothetical protein DFJ58DRAFT_29546 [Suillus subalutaceus]